MISRKEAFDLIEDVRKRLSIDEFDLAKECIRQPLLYDEVSSIAALARSDVNRTKEIVEIVRARLDIDIRSAPDKYGLAKATESAISNLVTSHKDLQLAKDQYLENMEISGALDSLLRTVEQRKSMLRDLVQLFIFQYYSAENSKSVSNKDVKQADEDAIVQARERSRRRRRSLDENGGVEQ